jgi:hypothetical protein
MCEAPAVPCHVRSEMNVRLHKSRLRVAATTAWWTLTLPSQSSDHRMFSGAATACQLQTISDRHNPISIQRDDGQEHDRERMCQSGNVYHVRASVEPYSFLKQKTMPECGLTGIRIAHSGHYNLAMIPHCRASHLGETSVSHEVVTAYRQH